MTTVTKRYEQITTDIERGDEQRGDDHTGGGIDHG
jgi:hypothetical protein